ncbi:hypothetical protein OKW50_008106 [Paraburkholderia youngii]
MKITTFGLDLAKRGFQVHWVDMETGEVKRRQLRRDQLVTFFAKQAPALIAMEACGSAHYWARHFVSFGHQVRLIAASFVRPFVKRNKTDVADAQAIWEAAQRPKMRFVAVKSETQQSVLTLHRVREQMVKMRQMQVNQIHGLLYEFGVAAHAGRQGMVDAVRALSELADTLPAMVVDTLREQFQRIDALARDIAALERTLAAVEASGRCHQTTHADWAAHGNGCHRHDRRRTHISVRTRICGVSRFGTPAERYRRAGQITWHQQTGGHLSAHAADPWCAVSAEASEEAPRITAAHDGPTTIQRGGCRTR